MYEVNSVCVIQKTVICAASQSMFNCSHHRCVEICYIGQ